MSALKNKRGYHAPGVLYVDGHQSQSSEDSREKFLHLIVVY